MLIFGQDDGLLILPPKFFDVLMKHGFEEEGAPAWTLGELEALLMDLKAVYK
jgi:hypothetical protein